MVAATSTPTIRPFACFHFENQKPSTITTTTTNETRVVLYNKVTMSRSGACQDREGRVLSHCATFTHEKQVSSSSSNGKKRKKKLMYLFIYYLHQMRKVRAHGVRASKSVASLHGSVGTMGCNLLNTLPTPRLSRCRRLTHFQPSTMVLCDTMAGKFYYVYCELLVTNLLCGGSRRVYQN